MKKGELAQKRKDAYNYWANYLLEGKIKVKVLLIAEAPPDSEDYFYFEDKYDPRSLSNRLFVALNIKETKETTKTTCLKKFIKKGIFLMDAIENPNYNKKGLEWQQQYKEKEKRIKEEIGRFKPKHIIIVGCGNCKNLPKSVIEDPRVRECIKLRYTKKLSEAINSYLSR